LIKGTSTGAVSDAEGNYSLGAASSDVLIFSSVGYVSQEITVGSQTTININLTEDIQSLEQIVVTGYGTQERKDVTGAISSVKGDDFKNLPVLE